MNIKKTKIVLSIIAFTILAILISIIISGQSRLKEIESKPPGISTSDEGFGGGMKFEPTFETMTENELINVMQSSIDGHEGDERARLEVELEEELERRHQEENEKRRKESMLLLEKRLAEEQKQRIEGEKMGEIIALASAPRVLKSAESGSSLSVKALDLAMTQLGKPYVWGAVGPDTFDCSGLVLWSYNNLGYFDMPRTTRGQWTSGTLIRRDQVQKGDLIYFLNNQLKSPVDHVGIYIGDGKMLHAPRPGKFVEITDVPWSRMVSIRRHFE